MPMRRTRTPAASPPTLARARFPSGRRKIASLPKIPASSGGGAMGATPKTPLVTMLRNRSGTASSGVGGTGGAGEGVVEGELAAGLAAASGAALDVEVAEPSSLTRFGWSNDDATVGPLASLPATRSTVSRMRRTAKTSETSFETRTLRAHIARLRRLPCVRIQYDDVEAESEEIRLLRIRIESEPIDDERQAEPIET
jgi:hypothetical protein